MNDKAILNNCPLVSVCIPLYNGEDFIEETLKSVLAQNYSPIEILISDHASSDESVNLVRKFNDPRVRLTHLSDGHTAADNWNSCIAEAKGTYVKLLCQDDILKPDSIRIQVEALENHPGSSFCFGPRDVISPRGRKLIRGRSGYSGPTIVDRDSFLPNSIRSGTNVFGEPCAVLMVRDALESAGPFSGSYLIDLDMWNRLWKLGPAIYVEESLSQFRIGNQSWTTKLKNVQAEQMREYLQSFSSEDSHLLSESDINTGINSAKKLAIKRSVLTSLIEVLHL